MGGGGGGGHLTSLVHDECSLLHLVLLPQHVYQVGGHSADHGGVGLLLDEVLQHLPLQPLTLLLGPATPHTTLASWLLALAQHTTCARWVLGLTHHTTLVGWVVGVAHYPTLVRWVLGACTPHHACQVGACGLHTTPRLSGGCLGLTHHTTPHLSGGGCFEVALGIYGCCSFSKCKGGVWGIEGCLGLHLGLGLLHAVWNTKKGSK